MVKISSLPHGFYEEQLKGYFLQFGDVTNVKVVRSLKTGRSKGVAFVEFSLPEVAEIAAETMNNYLLFKSLLKTEYIPPNKVKSGLFAKKVEVVVKPDGTQMVVSEVIAARKKEVRKLNAKPTEEQAKKRQKRLENKLKLKNKFIQKLGVGLNVESLVEGKVDLTTPVKAPSSHKAKKQNVNVKVTIDTPAAGGKAPKTAAVVAKKKPKAAVAKKTPAAGDKKKSGGKPRKSSKALEKEAKRADWKMEHEKKVKAKKAAKGAAVKKEETPKVPVAATPTPEAAPAKKEKKAPVVKSVAAAKNATPVTKAQSKAAGAKADAVSAKKAPVTSPKQKPAAPVKKGGKGGAAQKEEKKKVVAVKKTIEKKKPLKLTPKKKSVK